MRGHLPQLRRVIRHPGREQAVVWRYVKLQLFISLCGIIGPLYPIVYFTLVPQSDRHGFLWMFWAGRSSISAAKSASPPT